MSFSLHVSSAAWRADAEAWISERVEESGRRLTGAVEQRRVRPWATQLVAPTDAGDVWLKASGPRLLFEPALHATLARLLPDVVDAPLAIDPARGWLLTRGRGDPLGDSRPPTVADWRALLRLVARAQRELADHRQDVLASGLPDCSPGSVPIRLDRLVRVLEALPPDHPAHLDAAIARRLRELRPRIVDLADELQESALPTTFQHGDLHPRNVFTVEGGLRLFDFGDAQWAHATETLVVARRWVDEDAPGAWADVQGAYASVWDDVVDAVTLERLRVAARATQAVNHALTWWMCLDAATADEWQRWGHFPVGQLVALAELLDGGAR